MGGARVNLSSKRAIPVRISGRRQLEERGADSRGKGPGHQEDVEEEPARPETRSDTRKVILRRPRARNARTHTVGTGRVCRHKAIVNGSRRAAHSLRHWLSMGKTRLVDSYRAPRTDINRRQTEGELFSWAGTCFRQAHTRDVSLPASECLLVPCVSQ